MQFVDHLFIVLLLVVQPIYGAYAFRRFVRRVEAGEPANRPKLYMQTLATEWVALAALAAAWFWYSRPASSLGFVPPGGTGFWIAVGLAFVATGLMVYSWLAATKMVESEKQVQRDSVGDLAHFLPQSWQEFRSFFAISVTAGICEEIIYRGFVLWYLTFFMPLWVAVVVSSVIFGLGHSYQGTGGMLRVFVIGLAFGALYIISGSIWVPIVAHALFDILQGAMIVEVFKRGDNGNAIASEAPA